MQPGMSIPAFACCLHAACLAAGNHTIGLEGQIQSALDGGLAAFLVILVPIAMFVLSHWGSLQQSVNLWSLLLLSSVPLLLITCLPVSPHLILHLHCCPQLATLGLPYTQCIPEPWLEALCPAAYNSITCRLLLSSYLVLGWLVCIAW